MEKLTRHVFNTPFVLAAEVMYIFIITCFNFQTLILFNWINLNLILSNYLQFEITYPFKSTCAYLWFNIDFAIFVSMERLQNSKHYSINWKFKNKYYIEWIKFLFFKWYYYWN